MNPCMLEVCHTCHIFSKKRTALSSGTTKASCQRHQTWHSIQSHYTDKASFSMRSTFRFRLKYISVWDYTHLLTDVQQCNITTKGLRVSSKMKNNNNKQKNNNNQYFFLKEKYYTSLQEQLQIFRCLWLYNVYSVYLAGWFVFWTIWPGYISYLL